MDDAQFEAHQAHEEGHWWFTARREIVAGVVAHLLKDDEKPCVLDVGCGTGCTVAHFSESFDTIGIDTSNDAIRRARVRYPECQFIHGAMPKDAEGILPRVRLITLMDVLEHVEDDASLLASIVDAISDGAMIVITVPADMTLWSQHDVVLGHYRRYDAQGLASLWGNLPVECLLLSPLNWRLKPAVRFIRTIVQRQISSRGAAGTDLKMPNRFINSLIHSIFAQEKPVLLDRLERGVVDMDSKGVSLLAVIRKTGSDGSRQS